MASPTSILSPSLQIQPPPEVGPLDTRKYRALTLQNSLRVLLVSDHLSERAAVSMDIAVGSHSDPSNLPGLAHFLEHMLFLGTARYPHEGSYKQFLSENAGMSNAYTANENTNYHFALVAKKSTSKLKEALDRFAQFFIAPLFTESATGRELNAVQSEFERYVQSDGWRSTQVLRSCSNPAHPSSSFTIGSKETLCDVPNKNGINVRDALIHFHSKYYSANLMSLCVVAPHDLDVLQDWVVELFSDIRNNNAPNPCDAYKNIPPLLDIQHGRRFYIETVNDVRIVQLGWYIPSVLQEYRNMSSRFVCNMMNDEGEGSITSLLKKLDWADAVSSSGTTYRDCAFLAVTLSLTKKGVDHIDDIICVVFEYLHMLKRTGFPEWMYKEEKQVAENSFRFGERDNAYSLAINTAEDMYYYPTEDYISGGWLLKEYCPEKFMTILNHLSPDRCTVSIRGKFVSSKVTLKERWFGTKYHVEPLDHAVIARWADDKINHKLELQKPNHLIPTDFSIIAEQLPTGQDDEEGPQCIIKNKYMEVHHKVDRTFNRPKVCISIEFGTPLAARNPLNFVMFCIYMDLLEDSITEYSCIVERAGFDFSFQASSGGLRLVLSGYSDGIDKLIKDVIEKLKAFVPHPTRFEMFREIGERSLMNFDKSPPSSHASHRMACLMVEPNWPLANQLACHRDGSLNFEAMVQFSKKLLSRVYVTAMAYGNISATSFVSIMTAVQNTLEFSPLPEEERFHGRVIKAPLGTHVFSRFCHPNLDDNNSAIEVYYQFDQLGNFRNDAIYEVLADILEKPVFHELRTVQQLGYSVEESLQYYDGVGGIQISIQSAVASPDELLRRVEKLLVHVRQNVLEDMCEDKFQEYVDALITTKSEPDRRLVVRARRFWSELVTRYLRYDRNQQEVKALRTVTKEDVVRVFDNCVSHNGAETRRIVTQVFGSQHPFDGRDKLPEGAIDVTSPVAFRKQQPLFPEMGAHKPGRETLEV